MAVSLNAAGELPAELRDLRLEVRAFLQAEIASGAIRTEADAWMSGIDIGFSKRLAARGWVGMTIPAQYGGRGRSAFERYVVTEELLAAGAPVGAHWIADRQMAPSILRNGTEEQKQRYLPAIARAEAFFSIGMSEPDSGSDLASVRTRARLTPDGWRLTGTKLWTSVAHIATAMIVLARTDDDVANHHAGLSQFIVDLPNPGIRISPIVTIDGAHHFNEVVFDDALIPESALLGKRGDGWRQVTAELGNERSGPERILSTVPVLAAWAKTRPTDPVARADLGRLTARLVTLRQLSLAVAAELNQGGNPATEAALVKDLGTQFEGDVVVAISRHVGPDDEDLGHLLSQATLHVPAFTLRGGTTEVLRGIVAKGLTSPGVTTYRGLPDGSAIPGAPRTPATPGAPRTPANASGRQGIVSDYRAELAEAVSGVLGKDQDDWTTLAELGFTSLTVPEELGGSGGDLRDAAVVVAEAARQGSRLPLAEALFLAGPLLAAAGIELPDGRLASGVAAAANDNAPFEGSALAAGKDGRVTGTIPRVSWLRAARHLVTLTATGDGLAVALVPAAAAGLSVEPGENLAGEHRDTAVLADVTPARLMPLPVAAAPPGGWVHRAELLGAAARAVEIGGAARAVLDLTVTHTRDRVQFGKPLNRLQAVQQLLARLAADVTTVTVAADASVQALASGSPSAEILVAAAKAEASALAVEIAKAGHQLHGAIGYTEEHRLGGYTKRLWSWRQELGNELYWQRRIAGLIAGASGDLWPLITSTEGFTA